MTQISSLGLSQILLGGLDRANQSSFENQRKLSSGTVAERYGDLDGKAVQLLSAESLSTRSGAYLGATEQVLNTLEVQAGAYETIDQALGNLSAAVSRTLTDGTLDLLAIDLQSAARQVLSALNTEGPLGFVFGGDRADRAPVVATDLANLTSDNAALFQSGSTAEWAVGEGQTVSAGPTARDIGQTILDTFGELSAFLGANAGIGNLTNAASDALQGFLSRLEALREDTLSSAARQSVETGIASRAVETASLTRDRADLIVGDIESVDVEAVITALNEDQLAIQASARALGIATSLSLLEFI